MDYYNQLIKNYKARSNKDTVPKVDLERMSRVAANAWASNAPMFENVKSVKKTVKDNPHSFDYGPTYSGTEKAYSFGLAKLYKGRYYGPGYNKGKLGLKTASLSKTKKWRDWNKANDIAGFAGMPNYLVAQRARANRETALMRKRMGARLNLDNPNMNMTNRSQDSPRQVTRPQEPVSNLAGGLTKTRNSMQRLLK